MQPSLPLFSGDGSDRRPDARGSGRTRRSSASEPGRDRDRGPDRVDGVDGFLVGDEIKVDGLRGRFRCKAFFLDGDTPTAEVFGPLLDGRTGARVPAVRTFPVERLRPARR